MICLHQQDVTSTHTLCVGRMLHNMIPGPLRFAEVDCEYESFKIKMTQQY